MIGQSRQLLMTIGQSMARSAPDGWETVELHVTAAGGLSGTNVKATKGDGSEDRKFALDDEGLDAVAELRDEMWQADKGTWYNADFSLTRGGDFHAEFDYDNPPFGGDADAELLLEDQRLLPRAAERLPEWHPAAQLER